MARSVQPTTSALAVLGVAAAVLTLVLAGLAIARDLRRQRAEIRQWWRLGLARADRARVVAVSIVLGTTLGVALGLFGAWLLSPIGPVGSVRSVVPSPGRTVPSLVWVAAAALARLLGLVAFGLTVGAVRRPAWDDAEAAARRAAGAAVAQLHPAPGGRGLPRRLRQPAGRAPGGQHGAHGHDVRGQRQLRLQPDRAALDPGVVRLAMGCHRR